MKSLTHLTEVAHTGGYLINGTTEFWPEKRLLLCKTDRRSLTLQAPASGYLLELITRKPDIVSHADLILAGWGPLHEGVSLNTFYQSMLVLRQSLEEIGLGKNLILTVRRQGLTIPERIAVTPIGSLSPEIILNAPEKQLSETMPANSSHPEVRKKSSKGSKGYNKRSLIIFSSLGFSILVLFNIFLYFFNSPQESFFSQYYPSPPFEGCNVYVNNPSISNDVYMEFINRNNLDCDSRKWWYISAYINSPRISLVRCVADIVNAKRNYCSTNYYFGDKYDGA